MQYSKRDVKKLYKRLSKSAGRYSTKMKNLHGIAIRERRRFKLRVDDRTLALVVMGVRRWRVGLERRAKPGEKLAHKREAYERCSDAGHQERKGSRQQGAYSYEGHVSQDGHMD